MSLEDELRAGCGKAIGITLWKSDKGWQANVTRDKVSWIVGIDPDPVAALLDALCGNKPAAPAAPPKPRSVFD